MKAFLQYLRGKWKSVALVVFFAVIFFVVFALYALPIQAIAYATVLALFVFLLFVIFDYAAFRRRHEALRQAVANPTLPLALPAPKGQIENDYHALVTAERDALAAAVRESLTQQTAMRDYYTLWAHQIKTPIAAMHLLLQNRGNDEKELDEELRRIEQYVEMVLCYMRLDGDGHDLVIRTHALDPIIRHAVRDEASSFIRRRLQLVYEPVTQSVVTDEKWLLFVIGQLLSNALKYTKSGSVTIRMEDDTTLFIADTGIGIAPEDLPRICERGYTGCNGHNDRHSSGIGLYLTKRILDMLGHTLSFASEPGRGTQVRIGFPRERIRDA